MSLLWMDGFDYTTSSAQLANRYPAPGVNNISSINAGGGRRGGNSARFATLTNALTKFLTPGSATCITGFAWKMSTLVTMDVLRLFDSTGVQHVTAQITSAGVINVYRGTSGSGALLGSSAAGVISVAAGYQYIEAKVTISDTVGVIVIRVDGTVVITLSAQDTRNAGLANWGFVEVLQSAGGTTCDLDDWYILDDTGTINNDFLGDCRVDVQMPNAAGSNNASTPSTGTDRSATIDETPPNSDTDFNTVTGIGDKDTVNIANLINAGATPAGVQVGIFARKTDAGIAKIAPVVRVGGTDFDGTSVPGLDTAYNYFVQTYDKDPSGAAWTETAFNSTEVGYKRTA